MNLLVVLRNLYNNPDPFEDEKLLCDSDINVLTEACDLRDGWTDSCEDNAQTADENCLSALLISESKADYESVLKKAASYGADRIIYAPVDDFDFSDTNRFARLIGTLIKSISPLPDLVLFGRLAYDGDSVNIATQTAENLGWHRAIYSSEVVGLTVDTLTYKKALDEGALATVEVPLPAVLHTVRRGGLRGQAKIADIIRAYNDTTLTTIDDAVIKDAVAGAMARSGLPTPSSEIPPYSDKEDMVLLNGISDVDTARNIIDVLKSLGFEPK